MIANGSPGMQWPQAAAAYSVPAALADSGLTLHRP
jgi:hypothetical protein